MNTVSKDIDLSFLEQRVLLQVAIGVNETRLNFDNDVSILILGSVGHKSTAGELTATYERPILAVLMLTSLLHEAIVRWSINPDETLILEFSNQESLEIYCDRQLVESYVISAPGKTIVV
jgi:hypothetical protein